MPSQPVVASPSRAAAQVNAAQPVSPSVMTTSPRRVHGHDRSAAVRARNGRGSKPGQASAATSPAPRGLGPLVSTTALIETYSDPTTTSSRIPGGRNGTVANAAARAAAGVKTLTNTPRVNTSEVFTG